MHSHKKIKLAMLLALIASGSAAFATNSFAISANGNGNQQGDEGQGKDDDHDDSLRVDCRYHNEEKILGIGSCYASAVYDPKEDGFRNVRLGVGCDYKTIYNNSGRVQTEEVSERLSPQTAAMPGVEVFPKGSLRKVGTYESVLDIRAGRMAGTCYVHSPYDFNPLNDFVDFLK